MILSILYNFLLRYKRPISAAQQEKMFIFYGTTETQEATDNKGCSFTHILSSVCEENGGAVQILQIER